MKRILTAARNAPVNVLCYGTWAFCWSIWAVCFAYWWLAVMGIPLTGRWLRDVAAPAAARAVVTLLAWAFAVVGVVSRETHRSENVVKRVREGWARTTLGAKQTAALVTGLALVFGGLVLMALRS